MRSSRSVVDALKKVIEDLEQTKAQLAEKEAKLQAYYYRCDTQDDWILNAKDRLARYEAVAKAARRFLDYLGRGWSPILDPDKPGFYKFEQELRAALAALKK